MLRLFKSSALKIQQRRSSLLFGCNFLVRNLEGFCLPCSWPRDLQGQTSALANIVLKLGRFYVEASMGDLAAIASGHGELPVAGVVSQTSNILPADLLFTPHPRTRSNAINLD